MSASTGRQPCGADIGFARITPSHGLALTDALAVAELYRNGKLSNWRKKSFHAKRKSNFDNVNPEPEKQLWNCHWTLSLANMSRTKPDIVFRVGTELSGQSPEDPAFGIDILTGPPTLPQFPKVHFLIKLSSGGVWIVESTSDKEPVNVTPEGGEKLTLFAGETCTLPGKTNQVQSGERVYNIVFDNLDAIGEDAYLEERDSAIKDREGTIPDAGLWALPGAEDLIKIGRAIVRNDTESGNTDQIRGRLGIDARTGNALLVKSVSLGKNLAWKDLLLEMETLLTLKDTRGLIQALEIRCEHGYSINADIVANHGGKVDPLCDDPDCTVHMIMEHYRSFANTDWTRYKPCDKLGLLRDILEGVKKVHADGGMVRTIEERRLEVIPTEPPKAVLTEFGSIFRGMNAITRPVCKEYIRAPEIWKPLSGCSKYSSKTDMWHIGFAGLAMFIPDDYQRYTNRESGQSREWHGQMIESLDKILSSESEEESHIADVLKGLLCKKEAKRFTAEEALSWLPEYDRQSGTYRESEMASQGYTLDPDSFDEISSASSSASDEPEDDGSDEDDEVDTGGDVQVSDNEAQ